MEEFTCWWTDDGEGDYSARSYWLSAHRAAVDFAKHADNDAGGEISDSMMRRDASRLVSVRDAKGAVTTWRVSCWADIVWNADPETRRPASENADRQSEGGGT